MVLESMLNPRNAEDKPLHVFVISVLYTFVAVFFSYYLFPGQASILSVAMITIIFVSFFQKLFELEEEKENVLNAKTNMISRHAKSIYVYSAFFLGVIVAMSFIFIFFENPALFSLQSDTVRSYASGAATGGGTFSTYFFNNTQVLLLTFTLSVLFGAGAILILAWNASVIAVYAGLLGKSVTSSAVNAYVFGMPAALSGIALHGVPEILAYFVAGLAGGILSVGIIRENFRSKNFKLVFKDSLKFLVLAEAMIILAAFIEAGFAF